MPDMLPVWVRTHLVSRNGQQGLTTSAPTQQHTFALQLMTGTLGLRWRSWSSVRKLMPHFSVQMTGFVSAPPRSSILEKPCTSRLITRLQIQDKDESLSTAALPRCLLTQDQFQDTTSLKTMGEREDETCSQLPAGSLLFGSLHRCLVDTKQGGLNSEFRPRRMDHSLRLKLEVFLFNGDSRNSVSFQK